MKKVLITGINGMLGNVFYKTLKPNKNYELYGWTRTFIPHLDCHQVTGDLIDFLNLKKEVKHLNPDIIIHCAANTNVDACESDKIGTEALHVKSSALLAKTCPKAKFVYISTDAIFDGKIGNYTENDVPNPLSYYAQTKLEGEEAVLAHSNYPYIFRTNIYGYRQPMHKSLAEWAIKSYQENIKINGFDNVFFNAIYTNQLAKIIINFLEKGFSGGVYNIGSKNFISKYQFLKILQEKFLFSPHLLEQSFLDVSAFKAIRPLNTTLNTQKIEGLGIHLPTFEDGITELRKDLSNEIN